MQATARLDDTRAPDPFTLHRGNRTSLRVPLQSEQTVQQDLQRGLTGWKGSRRVIGSGDQQSRFTDCGQDQMSQRVRGLRR